RSIEVAVDRLRKLGRFVRETRRRMRLSNLQGRRALTALASAAVAIACMTASSPSRAQDHWAFCLDDVDKPPSRIYAFVIQQGRLYGRYNDGTNWSWKDLGKPGVELSGVPAVQSMSGGKTYAFVRGVDGHLYVNHGDDSARTWADQGAPPGSSAVGSPAAFGA